MKKLTINSKVYGSMNVYYDDNDHEIISEKTWSLWKSGGKTPKFYAITTNSTKTGEKQRILYMHRILMNPPQGIQIDHRDGDGLNNQRANIRLATHSQNHMNKRSWRAPKSGYRGVFLQVQTKSKYTAQICVNGKTIMVCGFNSPKDAAKEYNNLAIKHHGEFAVLNQL